MNRKYQPLALTGILAGMSLVLELFVHFPVLPAAQFLLYSPGDVPVILASLAVGPIAGAAAAFIKAVLFTLFASQGGPWGTLMHMVASGTMAAVIGYLWKKTGSLHLTMLSGIATRVAVMIPLNLAITPIFMGAPRAVVLKMIVPVIIPFNLIHAGINTILSYALVRGLPKKLTSIWSRDFR